MDYEDSETTDLFPASHDCIPEPFAGESLYSWCARYHRLNGGHNPRGTNRRLFGHPTAGLRPDLPFRLSSFQQNTRQRLGCLDDVLRQRTVLGFYAPFLPPSHMTKVSDHLASGNNVAARALLGLAKDGRGARSSLCFCPECISEQLLSHGTSWWQTKQMWPTINMCEQHGRLLVQVKDELLDRSSANFFLAHELDASRVNLVPHATSRQQQLLKSIGSWTTSLVEQSKNGLNESVLRYTYLLGAKRRGWLALDGSLRLKSLQESFLSQCIPLASFPAFHFIKDARGVNGGFLSSLFRQYPGRRHPSKHLVLMNFLFAEPEALFNSYEEVAVVIADHGQQGAKKLLTDNSQQLIRLVEHSGHSVSAAAGILNIPAGEALAHLNRRTDVTRVRRPHIVGTPRENQLREMLHEGVSRSEIAQVLSLRPAFIKDYLAQHPDLKAEWKTTHAAKETEKHRAQLISALNAHPGMSIKAIRRLPQNGFWWLYNNDRAWLQQILPAIWKRL